MSPHMAYQDLTAPTQPGSAAASSTSDESLDGPRPAAAGPLTEELWRRTAATRQRVYALEFLGGLADGSLPAAAFDTYLAQDALYLGGYADALARCADLADDEQARTFWAVQAQACIEEEQHLHRSRLAAAPVSPSPVTRGYLAHLRSDDAAAPRAQRYLRAVAAVLPCFWLYADVGARLLPRTDPAGPYRDWVQTYSATGFSEATARAVALLEQALAAADGAPERDAAAAAFATSMEWELAFFAQGLREDVPAPVGGIGEPTG